MARKTNSQIRKKWLILCEGRDAEEFLISYLNSHELSDVPAFSEDFQVICKTYSLILELMFFQQVPGS